MIAVTSISLSFQILLIDDDPVLNFEDFKVNTVWSFLLHC